MTATAQEAPARGLLACHVCGTELPRSRNDRRYCSNACKQRAWRQGMARVTPSKQRRPWIAD